MHEQMPDSERMKGAPVYEQRELRSSGERGARLCEWRGVNCIILRNQPASARHAYEKCALGQRHEIPRSHSSHFNHKNEIKNHCTKRAAARQTTFTESRRYSP